MQGVETHFGSYLSQILMDFISIWFILKLIKIDPRSPKSPNSGGSGSDQNPDRKAREPSPDRANNTVDARTSHTISSSKTNIRLRAMPVSVVMMVVMTVVAVVTVGAAVAVDALVAGHALVTRLGKGFSVKDC